MELYKSNISFTKFKIILLNWKCNEDYFDMLYVKIEAMGTEISSILGSKVLFRVSSSSLAGEVGNKTNSAQLSWSWG